MEEENLWVSIVRSLMVGVLCWCENCEVENVWLFDLSLDMVWCLCGVFLFKMWLWFWKICCLYIFYGIRFIRSKIVIVKFCFFNCVFRFGNLLKWYWDWFNVELDNLVRLLLFFEEIVMKFDKIFIFRFIVSYLRVKSFF